jgi:hypothetical protein
MNTDVNLIFEAYKNNILKEMALQVKDKTNAEKSLIDAITHGIETRTGDTYLFKGLQGEELKQRVEELVVPIIRDLFQDGVYTGRSSGDLKELEGDLLEKLAASNPRAKSQYTARILKSFIASVVDEVEGNVDEGETIEAASDDITDAVVDGAEKSEEVAQDVNASEQEQGQVSALSDRTTVRIEQMLANLIDDQGTLIKYVVDDVVQAIRDSGGLDLAEGKEKSKVESVLKNLINKQIFEKKGESVKIGKNFEAFEAGGSDSSIISDEDLIAQYTGSNKPTNPFKGTSGDSYFG